MSSMTNCNILTKTINQGCETEGATDKPAKDNPFSRLSTTDSSAELIPGSFQAKRAKNWITSR